MDIAEALTMLPADVLEALELASVRLNARQVDDIIETIAGQNAVVAHELDKLSKRFQYEQILAWIHSAQDIEKGG